MLTDKSTMASRAGGKSSALLESFSDFPEDVELCCGILTKLPPYLVSSFCAFHLTSMYIRVSQSFCQGKAASGS